MKLQNKEINKNMIDPFDNQLEDNDKSLPLKKLTTTIDLSKKFPNKKEAEKFEKKFPPLATPEQEKAIQDLFKNNPQLQNVPILTPEQKQENQGSNYLYEEGFIDGFEEDEPWIQTFSGRRFNPLHPNMGSIVIQDIAHSLSMLCRFTGHSKFFYSVAEHSVLVSYLCDPAYALQGLLHDASEYALQDMSSPLKSSGKFEEYKKYEKALQTMIYKRFGVDEVEHASVKKADLMMLATESKELMSPMHKDWKNIYQPLPFKLQTLSPTEAEKLFLARFNELF